MFPSDWLLFLQQNEENKKKNKLAALKAASELKQATNAVGKHSNTDSDLGESKENTWLLQ